jgi:hypothetical protein
MDTCLMSLISTNYINTICCVSLWITHNHLLYQIMSYISLYYLLYSTTLESHLHTPHWYHLASWISQVLSLCFTTYKFNISTSLCHMIWWVISLCSMLPYLLYLSCATSS